jgi:Bacterial TSP3 repeat
MSRGNQNAIVTVKGITTSIVDDPDSDGLTNTKEATSGTNPLKADSDGDGIDDPTELNATLTNSILADSDGDGANDGSESSAGTNPLDGTSRFAVKSSVKAGANFTVTWASVVAKTYRVVRSLDPAFTTYDVVGAEIIAAPPQQSLTDMGGASQSRMFYRVELEP